MNHISIIGTGNIGMRYIESIYNEKTVFKINCFDTKKESLLNVINFKEQTNKDLEC